MSPSNNAHTKLSTLTFWILSNRLLVCRSQIRQNIGLTPGFTIPGQIWQRYEGPQMVLPTSYWEGFSDRGSNSGKRFS